MSNISDRQKQETIKLLLQDLQNASKLVDSVARRSHLIEQDLDRSNFLYQSGKALGEIFELQDYLFDIEPTLTPDYLKLTLAPVNLDESLKRLLSTNNLEERDNTINSAVRDSTINEFKNYMSDRTASKFSEAIKAGTEYDFAKKWWDSQEKPFIPIVRVYKQLKHDRRYIRFHAAKLLESEFKVKVWNEDNNDVELDRINQVLSKWPE